MAKAFKEIFNITDKDHDVFRDSCIWTVVSKYPAKKLLRYIFKYLDTVQNLNLKFYDIEKTILGTYDNFDGNENICLSSNLRINEIPAVFLHEVFHAIFPQIENDKYIVKLEMKAMKAITLKEGYKVLRFVFNNTSWGIKWKKQKNRKLMKKK